MFFVCYILTQSMSALEIFNDSALKIIIIIIITSAPGHFCIATIYVFNVLHCIVLQADSNIHIATIVLSYIRYLPSAGMPVPGKVSDAVPVHVSSLTVAVQITSKSPSGIVYVLPVWELMAAPLTLPVHV